jgi:uncharacterized protein (TIGR02266 family)
MNRKKVVLADDVELFLMLENSFFNRNDFELITARSGLEILKVIREAKPDLVFMDLDMPEMNGDDCCRIVKKDVMNRHIPVIIVTQGGRKEAIERCRMSGCDDIVLKPINRNNFMESSRKFLQVLERAAQRFVARLPVNYGVKHSELLSDHSIDLTIDGMFLETGNLFEVDTMLYLEFVIPATDREIRCNGRVAWVNHKESPRKPLLPTGVGVQFLHLGERDKDAIRDYIESRNIEPRADEV